MTRARPASPIVPQGREIFPAADRASENLQTGYAPLKRSERFIPTISSSCFRC